MMINVWLCERCGAMIRDEHTYCPRCGKLRDPDQLTLLNPNFKSKIIPKVTVKRQICSKVTVKC